MKTLSTDDLIATMLGRERQYRDAFMKIADLLRRSNQPHLSAAAQGLAETYGFAFQDPEPPTVTLDDDPVYAVKVRALAEQVLNRLSLKADTDYSPRELKTAVRSSHAEATWACALEIVRRHPQVHVDGQASKRRYRWLSRSQAIA